MPNPTMHAMGLCNPGKHEDQLLNDLGLHLVFDT